MRNQIINCYIEKKDENVYQIREKETDRLISFCPDKPKKAKRLQDFCNDAEKHTYMHPELFDKNGKDILEIKAKIKEENKKEIIISWKSIEALTLKKGIK